MIALEETEFRKHAIQNLKNLDEHIDRYPEPLKRFQ